MIFTSHIFIFYFLPLALLIYYLLPYRLRNGFLSLASYLFYGWWKPWFVLLMITSTLVDYFCARAITSPGASATRRRLALTVSIVVNLGLLAFFKYYMFTMTNLNDLLSLVGADTFRILEVTLPIGISFYTFQTMSYSIDVYRGDAKPVKTFSDFACFVSLFPQLIAGPIVRYHSLAEQLHGRTHSVSRFASGVAIFVLGFSKKILLANSMGVIADAAFAAEHIHVADAWFGVIAYAFQIYFDFAGYSDMAVGLGRMFGFEIPRNFNAPYLAQSITEFWRRWHISLSTFLRDYLYVPLGGNRKGHVRTYVNLGIVMLLGGLWHGANWTFLAWGAYHGVLLAFERWRGGRSLYGRLPAPMCAILTFVLILFSWVLFRSETISSAGDYFSAMLGLGSTKPVTMLLGAKLYTSTHLATLAICIVFIVQPVQAFDWCNRLSWFKVVILIALFQLALIEMSAQTFNPFLYFQF